VPKKIVPIPPPASDHVAKLPIQQWGFVNCPAVPYWADPAGDPDLAQIENTVALLKQRAEQGDPAYCGLAKDYTIGGQTLPAYTFLYGEPLPKKCGGPGGPFQVGPTMLPLDLPSQYELAWTTYQDVWKDSQDLVKPFAETLTDVKKAEKSFWPTIACFGLPLNLLVVEKVDSDRLGDLAERFGDDRVDDELRALQADGLLYAIDMSILESVGESEAPDTSTRFVPATYTLLQQNPTSKELTPLTIQVWTNGVSPQTYSNKDKAWLWAIQAAKASITVWGIWLGHVYHWHLVTAAMQMTMHNNLPPTHKLAPLVTHQAQSLIQFDYVLMTLLWGQITPPTPVNNYMALLPLLEQFAGTKRGFFDDDPHMELKARGLVKSDFTTTNGDDWDAYPVVGYMVEIFRHTADFVKVVVDDLYKSDPEVANDTDLQNWINASGDPTQGNVRGLPAVKTRGKLVEVLTSLLYRVNVHGAAGMAPMVNPALAFVSNFPPCLQSSDIPAPTVKPDLLQVLPHTGAIGAMTTFVFTFAYSPPYESLIPGGGENLDPWFPPAQVKSNAALVTLRKRIRAFVDEYVSDWNAELLRLAGKPPGAPPPAYSAGQYQQWPTSIEI
jgi:hypothetical protein